MNGYTKHYPIDLTTEAHMLETVAGYSEGDVMRELAFAVLTLDAYDPASLRWLACLCARRVGDLD